MHLPSHPTLFFRVAALIIAMLCPVMGQEKEEKSEDHQPQLRLVCLSSLEEEQEVFIASRDDEEKWKKHGKANLRASFISDWLPAQSGELHLTVREQNGSLRSLATFSYPDDTKRLLVVLIAKPDQKTYQTHVVDPQKLGFEKGTILVSNFSTHTGLVHLGSKEEKVEAEKQSILKPTPEDNGMYQMMVSYLDAQGKAVSCFDRYVSANPNSREMLFLLPEEKSGLKVQSLKLFGTIE